jgi:arginine decarboxylase
LQAEHGDTVSDLLRYVHFDPDDLRKRYHEKVAHAKLEPAQREAILEALESGLRGYTYLED